MYPQADLRLLSEKLEGHIKSPYFDNVIKEHANALVKVIAHVLQETTSYNNKTLKYVIKVAWTYLEYLKGSSLNQRPYEIEFCMDKVLKDWFPNENHCIATALIDKFEIGKNFHFRHFVVDPWEIFLSSLNVSEVIKPEGKLILMGLPRMYNLSPLYCTPLYHELGHFVDISNGISENTLKRMLSKFEATNPNESEQKIISHIREHFADLFAACYLGETIADILDLFGTFESNDTHPATPTRTNIIRTFVQNNSCLIDIEGKSFNLLDNFNSTLSESGFKKLEKRFIVPNLESAYDDIRPYEIQSDEELHGLFVASWEYLKSIIVTNGPEWARKPNSIDQSRIVNNMVSKSIQNYIIKDAWNGVSI